MILPITVKEHLKYILLQHCDMIIENNTSNILTAALCKKTKLLINILSDKDFVNMCNRLLGPGTVEKAVETYITGKILE